ncbi:hypothetical protein PQX77_009294 [Marasmius sp. AFHP31]|nr:hypothetical protein PQX77_009294 [Marasmius sp. AFHP31]
MFFSSWHLLIPHLFFIVKSQELSVPPNWDKRAIYVSREERINLAAAAIDAFIQSDNFQTQIVALPPTYWPYGEFLARMADFDIYTSQTRYKDVAQQHYLPALVRLKPDENRYAYALTRAWIAYKDEEFLNIARDYWTSTRHLTISQADIQSGTSLAKLTIDESSIVLTCSANDHRGKISLVGGTFHNAINASDLTITLDSTAGYLTLTASLAAIESKPNETYIDLAKQQAEVMLNVLYGKSNGVFFGTVRALEDCPLGGSETLALFNAAVSMQGLSLYALVSRSDSLEDILRNMTRYATTFDDWHYPNGVLDFRKVVLTYLNNTDDYMQQLFRSYFDLAINANASDLKIYLRRYLAVQYNEVVKRTTQPEVQARNIYGPGLHPDTQFNPSSQMLAITTLLGGVILDDEPGSPADPGDHSQVHIGVIIGGVALGGVFGLVMVIVAGYFYRRWLRQSRSTVIRVDPYPAASTGKIPIDPTVRTGTSPFSKGERWGPRTPSSACDITDNTTSTRASSPHSVGSWSGPINEATTPELVMALNSRLENGRWDPNEPPPEYPRSVLSQ